MNKLKIFLILILLIITIFLYAMYIGTNGLNTKEYTIYEDKLPPSYNGLKIVHFSDLHYGNLINKKRLEKIVKEINLIKPDIVVFTGDLLDNTTYKEKEKNNLIENLKNIKTKYGKYAILGNHDYEKDTNMIKEILTNSDFFVLINSYDIITNENNDKIFLGGLDDCLLSNPDTDKTLSYLKDNNLYSIILVHEPDYTTDILNYKDDINLILAGHSHNGQVRLPIIGAIYTPNGAKKYYDNHYKINNTNLYISSGIGNSKLDIRLFNHPSINFYRINSK